MPQETPTLEDLELSVDRGPRPAGSPGPSDAQDSPDPAKALLGRVLKGQYVISSVLGQGAMGLVFRGTQRGLEKVVAIKVMHLEGMHTREWRDRFEREATTAAHLDHPNVAAASDYGRTEDGRFYLVLEYVEGHELRRVLDEAGGPLPLARALFITRQPRGPHCNGPVNDLLGDGTADARPRVWHCPSAQHRPNRPQNICHPPLRPLHPVTPQYRVHTHRCARRAA